MQAKALRSTRRAGLSASALLGDFADEVADLVGANGEDAKGGLAEVGARGIEGREGQAVAVWRGCVSHTHCTVLAHWFIKTLSHQCV